jgi:hypothetical protein
MSKWKYTLEDDLVRYAGRQPPIPFLCRWGTIDSLGVMLLRHGYSWDGCTLAPDGPINPETGKPYTYAASAFHDFGYQFADEIGEVWGRSVSDVLEWFDDAFRFVMEQDGVEPWRRKVYYAAVRALGRPFNRFMRKARSVLGIETACDQCETVVCDAERHRRKRMVAGSAGGEGWTGWTGWMGRVPRVGRMAWRGFQGLEGWDMRWLPISGDTVMRSPIS